MPDIPHPFPPRFPARFSLILREEALTGEAQGIGV